MGLLRLSSGSIQSNHCWYDERQADADHCRIDGQASGSSVSRTFTARVVLTASNKKIVRQCAGRLVNGECDLREIVEYIVRDNPEAAARRERLDPKFMQRLQDGQSVAIAGASETPR